VFDDAPEDQVKCDYEGPDGCDLEREHRPMACRAYLCLLGKAVLVGAMTKVRADELLVECGQWGEEAWGAIHNWGTSLAERKT